MAGWDWPEWTGQKSATRADLVAMINAIIEVTEQYGKYQWFFMKVMPTSMHNFLVGINKKVKDGKELMGYYQEFKDVRESLQEISRLGPNPSTTRAAAAYGRLMVRFSKLVSHLPIPTASYYADNLAIFGRQLVPIADMLSSKAMYLRSGYTEQDLRDLYVIQ